MGELKDEEEHELLQLCYLAKPENPKEKSLRKEEVKSKHNILNKLTKKDRKANKNGIITKRMR